MGKNHIVKILHLVRTSARLRRLYYKLILFYFALTFPCSAAAAIIMGVRVFMSTVRVCVCMGVHVFAGPSMASLDAHHELLQAVHALGEIDVL